MKLNIVDLGLIDYHDALEIQEKLVSLCDRALIDDTLLLLEHPSVLTLGTSADTANIYLPEDELHRMGISVCKTSRGGDVTYHGPGQLVGYPIFNLINHGKDIRDYISKLQEVIIRLLSEHYDIHAHRELSKYTGVYVGDSKITAIGIAVTRWISYHGFAFNINTDLSHFKWINPCGLSDRGVTSLQQLTGAPQSMSHVKQLVSGYFCDVFKMEANECKIQSLIG